MKSKRPKYIDVEQAEYLSGYKLRIRFNDGTEQEVDFGPFLRKAGHPDIRKYKRITGFRKFRIDGGNLMWGDYEMIFPVIQLYNGKIEI
jgi:hypothetical protein